jgi:predicted ATPase/DNA-binding CsgD family transcriptional regulator
MAAIPGTLARADSAFIGRDRELALFQSAFDDMLQGRCRVMTLLGEPGIGKTRCVEACGRAAEEQGALVLWGRCYEERGAPPYWPWVQVLRDYIAASSQSELQLALSHGAEGVAALVPEVAEHLQQLRAAPQVEREPGAQARFRAFDAVAQFLIKAAQQVPLVVIIDNLHWADVPSLSLLEFLSHELSRSRMLILATYRDGEVARGSALLDALGGLDREAHVQRVRLKGLDEAGIGALAGHLLDKPLPGRVIDTIYEQTDGNPLFVIELLKVLIEESRDAGIEPIAVRIPDGVREAIGRRVGRLDAACSELLTTASVLGRDFGADEVAAMGRVGLDAVLDALEGAVRADLVEAAGAGRYRFTHALIRETLCEEIGTLERLRLHARAGDALVEIHGARLERVLTRVAHHYFESAALGEVEKAVEFASRAAAAAAAVHAYEQAVTHYDQLIDVLEWAGRPDDERVARAHSLKGDALLCSGRVDKATEALLQAVNHVHKLGDVSQLIDVVSLLILTTSDGPQQAHRKLLEKALQLLPAGDGATRARALASLAFSMRSGGKPARIQALVEEATSMAERVGDADARCFTLKMAILALRGQPETLEERLQLGTRQLALARASDAALHAAEAHAWQALNLLEAGEIDACAALLDSYENVGMARFGLHQSFLQAYRTTVALLRGEWDGLEERIDALREIGLKTRRVDAEGVYGAQMFALNRDLGRLEPFEPVVRRFAESGVNAWTPGLMLLYAELGMLDDARRELEELAADDFAALARDDMYAACLVFCAETCWRVGDSECAAQLYGRLLPYAEQTLNHPRAVCFGSAQLYLGMLAEVSGHGEAAREHFAAAVERNRAMRAWPWVARAQFHCGAYSARLGGEHEAAGVKILREAEELAGRLRMARLLEDIGRLLRGAARQLDYPDGLTAREMEVLQLIALGRSNKDVSLVLSISLNTVATHVRSILTKTHCANRTEAAAYAMRNGLQEEL